MRRRADRIACTSMRCRRRRDLAGVEREGDERWLRSRAWSYRKSAIARPGSTRSLSTRSLFVSLSRRDFLGAGAAAAGLTLARPAGALPRVTNVVDRARQDGSHD